MVDHVVNVIVIQIVVRLEGVAIDHRSGFNVSVDLTSQRLAAHVRYNHRADFAVSFLDAGLFQIDNVIRSALWTMMVRIYHGSPLSQSSILLPKKRGLEFSKLVSRLAHLLFATDFL